MTEASRRRQGWVLHANLAPALESALADVARLGRLYLDRLAALTEDEGEPGGDERSLLAAHIRARAVIYAHEGFVDALDRARAIANQVTRSAGRETTT